MVRGQRLRCAAVVVVVTIGHWPCCDPHTQRRRLVCGVFDGLERARGAALVAPPRFVLQDSIKVKALEHRNPHRLAEADRRRCFATRQYDARGADALNLFGQSIGS